MTIPLENTSGPAAGELPGQVPVVAQDRGQDQETVERGVRGQHQDRRGEPLHQEEEPTES